MSYEIEKYGFLRVLRENYSFPNSYIPRIGWQHGWSFTSEPIPEEFNVIIPRDINYPKVVQGSYVASVFRSLGGRDVLPFCLPYFLVPPQGALRKRDSILFVYPRFFGISDSIRKFTHRFTDFIDITSRDFDHIGVLVSKDYEHKYLRAQLGTLGSKFNFYEGAAVNDPCSLYRLRRIFETFEYLSSPVFGSHVYYAMETGVSVSVSSVFAEQALNINAPWYADNPDTSVYERFSMIHSFKFLQKMFPSLINDSPRNGKREYKWPDFCEGRPQDIGPSQLDNVRSFTGANMRGYARLQFRKVVKLF